MANFLDKEYKIQRLKYVYDLFFIEIPEDPN